MAREIRTEHQRAAVQAACLIFSAALYGVGSHANRGRDPSSRHLSRVQFRQAAKPIWTSPMSYMRVLCFRSMKCLTDQRVLSTKVRSITRLARHTGSIAYSNFRRPSHRVGQKAACFPKAGLTLQMRHGQFEASFRDYMSSN